MLPNDIPNRIYKFFSFAEGAKPDFDELLACFVPEGLFINNKGEFPQARPLNDFVAFITSNIEAGNILSIEESEIENSVAIFGKVGHIVSKYRLEAKVRSGLQVRYGVNLFQIIKSGEEWKVSSMCWDDYEDQRLLEIDIHKCMHNQSQHRKSNTSRCVR